MGFVYRLWQTLFPSSPAAPPRPAAAAAADSTTHRYFPPPRYHYRSREEVELALLLPWLTDAERARFLDRLLPNARKYLPWTEGYVWGEPWQQCQQWGPLVLQQPETMSIKGFCGLMGAELGYGLSTFCTPLALLSRPVRMLWLWRQGRRAGQVYAALEQALGNRAQALDYAWWVVAGL